MSALPGLVGVLLVLGAAGCSMAPVQNFASNVPPGLTADAVRDAIIAGATLRGWVVRDEPPAKLVATLVVRRKHSATVEIAYDAAHYTITYRDSTNLDYDGEEIHENYNAWVAKLDRTIQNELVRASRLSRGSS